MKIFILLFLINFSALASQDVSDTLDYLSDEAVVEQNNTEAKYDISRASYNAPVNAVANVSNGLLSANEFLALLFGIPSNEDATFGDFAINATPIAYIEPFFKWMVEISLWALSFVFLISGIRASIDTAREYEFMGRNVSTPFVAIRVAIALLFILPMPGGYTTLQTFILYSSYQISNVNTKLYSEVVDKVIDVDSFKVKSSAGAPFISKIEYSRLLSMAICQREFKDELGSLNSERLKSGTTNAIYNSSRGRKTVADGYSYYGYKNFFGTSGFSWGSRKGACGAFVYQAIYPKVSSNPGVFMRLNNSIGTLITTMLTSYSGALNATMVNDTLPSTNNVLTLKAIANKLAVSDSEYKEEDLKLDFDNSWIEVNKIISQGFNLKNEALKGMILGLVEPFKDEVKAQGWLMAGANLYRMASVQSLMSSLSNTKLVIFDLDRTVLKKSALKDIKEYEERVAVVIDVADSNNGTAHTALVNKVDSDAFTDTLGDNEYGSACALQGFNDDCLGDAYIQQAINLSKDLMSNSGVHPLTYFHAYGVTGFDDIKVSLLLTTAGVTVSKAIGYAFKSSSFTVFEVIGNLINDAAERVYSVFVMLYKTLGAIFLILGYYLPMAVLIAWIIVVADWAITLYIMLFTSPLFAVFHGITEGHGFTSQYAQRGYPALLGAIFMPFFMLAGLFVYLITSYVVFIFVGGALNIALGFINDTSNVGYVEGAFIWLIVLGIMIYVNNMLITIITNFVDRVLRTLGVHEALTSNSSHMDTYHAANQDAQKTSEAQAELTRQVNSEGGVGSRGPYDPGGSDGGGGSGGGSGGTGTGGSTSNVHTKANNETSSPAEQPSGNQQASDERGYDTEKGEVNSVGTNNGNLGSSLGGYDDNKDPKSSNSTTGYNPQTGKVETLSDNEPSGQSNDSGHQFVRGGSNIGSNIKAGIVGVLGAGNNVTGTVNNSSQGENNDPTEKEIPVDVEQRLNNTEDEKDEK